MRNRDQYVTISHYKEREFHFLSYAIQTEEGFIPKVWTVSSRVKRADSYPK